MSASYLFQKNIGKLLQWGLSRPFSLAKGNLKALQECVCLAAICGFNYFAGVAIREATGDGVKLEKQTEKSKKFHLKHEIFETFALSRSRSYGWMKAAMR